MSITNKLRQYGLKNSFVRSSKKLLRNLGINIETYVIFAKSMSQEYSLEELEEFKIKELYNIDHLSRSPLNFSESRIALFKYRLENNFNCYGVFKGDELIYCCWVSLKLSDFPNNAYTFDLKQDEGLLLDAICHPKARGRGIHSFMSKYRSNELYRKGRVNQYVVVIKDNTPAIKAQLSSGFKPYKSVTVTNIFGNRNTKIASYN